MIRRLSDFLPSSLAWEGGWAQTSLCIYNYTNYTNVRLTKESLLDGERTNTSVERKTKIHREDVQRQKIRRVILAWFDNTASSLPTW